MTIIFPSPIFGPIHSRRLGVSLGINLLPDDGKVCSFDCIYCECGFNAEHRTKKLLPTREEVRAALEEKLKDMQVNGPAPDVLTFAGNGEPTAHPHFPEIIEDTLALRNQYFPKAKVSVLSNSTFIDRPAVFEALNKVDNNILKLDTVDEEYMAAWLVTTTKNTAINYMKKRARECPKADIELFSDLYSKEYAESAEEHVFHKILQKEKVGYGWTILDALYEENENWYEAITMVYCLERKQKDVAESMGISIQALTGVLYRARKWVKIHYNSDDYTK